MEPPGTIPYGSGEILSVLLLIFEKEDPRAGAHFFRSQRESHDTQAPGTSRSAATTKAWAATPAGTGRQPSQLMSGVVASCWSGGQDGAACCRTTLVQERFFPSSCSSLRKRTPARKRSPSVSNGDRRNMNANQSACGIKPRRRFACRKSLAEFRRRSGEIKLDYFWARRVRARNYFSGCKRRTVRL